MFRSDRGRRRQDLQRSLSHSNNNDASSRSGGLTSSGWFQRPATRSSSHRRQGGDAASMADLMSRSGPASQFSRHTQGSGLRSTAALSETASHVFKSSRGGNAPVAMGIAATADGMHAVHWEGQVRKKGDWLPRWESRYLVLDGTVMRYYSKPEDARMGKHLRGKMILTHVSPEFHKKKDHTFVVETASRKVFYMSCDTELEKDMWVEMIQAAISEAAAPQRSTRHGGASTPTAFHTQPRQPQISSHQHPLNQVTPQSASNRYNHQPKYPQPNDHSVYHELLQPPILTKNSTYSSIVDTPRDTMVHADIRDFYNALRKLLLSHSSSAQFFPKLSRDIAFTSNYAPTVPFWGDYHGLDGILHFFSILYDSVDFASFFVTDIAYATDGRSAVVTGRETMVNKVNHRKFTQQWQHSLKFANDGRVRSLAITADPIAASAVFGCNAMSSLRLPRNPEYDMDYTLTSSAGGGGTTTWPGAAGPSLGHFLPNGLVQVHVVRGEQLGGLDDDDDLDYNAKDLAMPSPYSNNSGSTQRPSSSNSARLEQSHSFMIAFSMEKPRSNQPTSSTTLTTPSATRTEPAQADSMGDPRWQQGDVTVPFGGAAAGQPCMVQVEAWKVTHHLRHLMSPLVEDSTQDDNDASKAQFELIGIAKINLAPFIALAVDRPNVDTVPQWYTLLSVGTTSAFACGRVLLSVRFDVLGTNNRSLSRTSLKSSPSPTPRRSPVKLQKKYSYSDPMRANATFQVGNTVFDVPLRYEMIKAVGQGAYGCVIAASDVETGQSLAIKNVPNAFSDLIDAKRILREIRLMQHLKHPKLVNLVDLFRPPSLNDFEDVYIVTELMETDLHRVINSNQILSDDHVQHFLYQMLVAVKFVHSANVLHRDLKPSNILVNADCDIKLCDFGLARGLQDPTNQQDNGQLLDQLTDYVVTRWYRAPEVLLTCTYGKPMDMWAIGCILAELIGRRPLFPGTDFLHQLKIIMEVVGTPDESTLDFVTHAKAKRFITKQPKRRPIPFATLYPNASPLALDLLDRLLTFDPRHRINVDDALNHPYLSGLRDPALEVSCPAGAFDYAFENVELTKPNLQALMFEDICHFHPEALGDTHTSTNNTPVSRGTKKITPR